MDIEAISTSFYKTIIENPSGENKLRNNTIVLHCTSL